MKKIYILGLLCCGLLTQAQNAKKIKFALGSDTKKNSASVAALKNGGNNQINQLTGSITCGTAYVAGTPQTFVFTLTFTNTDFEYGDSLALTFPAGMTPVGTSNTPDFAPITDMGTGQTTEAYNGVVGQTITWGDDDNNYGGIESLGNVGGITSYTFDVMATSTATLTGTQNVAFHLSGDNYGASPGPMVGIIPILAAGSVDAAMTAVMSSSLACNLGGNEQVMIMVTNNGSAPISNVPVGFTVNGGAPVVEMIPGPIAPSAVGSYTFTGTANLSAINTYTITAAVVLTGDVNSANDAGSFTTEHYASHNTNATPYVMGFETAQNALLAYWTVENTNADATAWALANTYNHGGSFCLRKAGSAANDDDWAFTGCVDLTGGQTYQLDYWYKQFDLVAICNLETKYGTADNSAAMTTTIVANPVQTDTLYHLSSTVITPAVTGSYHIGFHAYATTGTSSIRVDDINLFQTTVGIKEVNTESISVFPNPSNGVFTVKTIENNSNITVMNVLGSVVYSKVNVAKGNNNIDLSQLGEGAYFIKVANGNNNLTTRIVITK